MLPTRVWDWAMRKVAFLTPKTLGTPVAKPAEQPFPAAEMRTVDTPTRPRAPARTRAPARSRPPARASPNRQAFVDAVGLAHGQRYADVGPLMKALAERSGSDAVVQGVPRAGIALTGAGSARSGE